MASSINKGPREYKRVLDSLMSSVHCLAPEQEYPYELEYTDKEKRQITPEELVRWLSMRTFGTTNPSEPNVTIRPLVRANTLAFWKKAISVHMPDCLHGWRTESNDGNPTKSAEVNDFVRQVKKLEAKNKGLNLRLVDRCSRLNFVAFMRYSSRMVRNIILPFGGMACPL